jgi:carboxyl-terminal processing protease
MFSVYVNYDYWVFKTLITNFYAFPNALDELYDAHLEERDSFDKLVIAVMTAELSRISGDRFTHLYEPQEIKYVRETDKEISRTAEIIALDNDTVYMYIPNISRGTRKFIYDNRKYLDDYENLVLDLRDNYGGWLPDFHKIADLFVPRDAVISRQEARTPLLSREIISRNENFFAFESITILQNEFTASSAEALIMALREHTPNVTTAGQTTFGKGTAQVTIPLTGGYAIRATIMRVLGPLHECINNVGIAPIVN